MKFNGGEPGMLKRKKIGVRLADASRGAEEGGWGSGREEGERREVWHVGKGRRGRAQKVQERREVWVAGDSGGRGKCGCTRREGGEGGWRSDVRTVGGMCWEEREGSGEGDSKVKGPNPSPLTPDPPTLPRQHWGGGGWWWNQSAFGCDSSIY